MIGLKATIRGIRGRAPKSFAGMALVVNKAGKIDYDRNRTILTAGDVAGGGGMPPVFTTTTNGVVPAPGSVTGKFLRDDATWATAGGGGSDPFAAALAVPTHPGFDPNFAGVFGTTWTLSNNNRDAVPGSGSPYNHIMGAPANFTGKKYYELIENDSVYGAAGIVGPAGHRWDGGGNPLGASFNGQIGWHNGGTVTAYDNNTGSVTIATIQTWANGDRLCIAADLDALLIWFRTNAGNWNNSGANDPATGVGGIGLSPCLSGGGGYIFWPALNSAQTSGLCHMYLNTADFTETVPTGYGSWSGL